MSWVHLRQFHFTSARRMGSSCPMQTGAQSGGFRASRLYNGCEAAAPRPSHRDRRIASIVATAQAAPKIAANQRSPTDDARPQPRAASAASATSSCSRGFIYGSFISPARAVWARHADFVAEVFCPSECVRLIQDQASMRNVDSRIHSLRFDCCVFLFYSFSAVTFATKSASNGLTHRSKRHLYSITSSARASSVGGISRPSAFAVLRL